MLEDNAGVGPDDTAVGATIDEGTRFVISDRPGAKVFSCIHVIWIGVSRRYRRRGLIRYLANGIGNSSGVGR